MIARPWAKRLATSCCLIPAGMLLLAAATLAAEGEGPGAGQAPKETKGDAAPTVFWVSEPVLPGEMVLTLGSELEGVTGVELRAPDGTLSVVRPEQVRATSLAFRLPGPAGFGVGAFKFQLQAGGAPSREFAGNAPRVDWVLGDQGTFATPGGTLRAFGRCLSWPAVPERCRARLVAGDREVPLKIGERSLYALACELPPALAPGAYARVVADGLVLPKRVSLQGERRSACLLAWPWGSKPLAAAISGTSHFAVENLTLFFGAYKCGIKNTGLWGSQEETGNVTLRNLVLRGHRYLNARKLADVTAEESRIGIGEFGGHGAMLCLGGENLVVEGCDVVSSEMPLWLGKGRAVRIERNRFVDGLLGFSWIYDTQQMVFAHNTLQGGLLGNGYGIAHCGSAPSRNLYIAENTYQDVFGADREAITTDCGMTYYVGKPVHDPFERTARRSVPATLTPIVVNAHLTFNSAGLFGGAIWENRSAGQGPRRSKPSGTSCLNWTYARTLPLVV